jgi:Protein of unknown function (DUF4197)
MIRRTLFVFLWAVALVPQMGCDEVENILGTTGISNEEVVDGLKEALKVGTDSTVTQLNINDGYFGNALIKIPMPEYADNVVQLVNQLGGAFGQQLINTVVLKMNRAAEEAAVEAKPIFVNAITGMSIQDGWNILKGADTAATGFLRSNTNESLYVLYRPYIETAMTSVGVQQAWLELSDYYNTICIFGGCNPVPTDISDHVTNKALNGLFVVVGQKETAIRNNVANRVTDLLRRVFAEQD